MSDFLNSTIWILLGHVGSGLFTLWAFSPRNERMAGGRVLAAAVLFLPLNLLVEGFLSTYLREGTLIFQWVLFVLLAHKFARLPMGLAMLAMFCHFALMLGVGIAPEMIPDEAETSESGGEVDVDELLGEDLDLGEDEAESPAAESDAPPPAWATRTADLLLSARMASAASLAREKMYGHDRGPSPAPAPAPDPTSTTPPLPVPTPTPTPTRDASYRPMSEAEFFQLFATDVALRPTPIPAPDGESGPPAHPPPTLEPTPSIVDVLDPRNPDEPPEPDWGRPTNVSTDPRYNAPGFNIDAIGIGASGAHAIVNGRVVSKGSIIRTEGGTVRGWRLIQIERNTLRWQPLL